MNDEPEPGNRWRIVNTLCGILSAALLVVGISLLAAFAYLNAPFRHA